MTAEHRSSDGCRHCGNDYTSRRDERCGTRRVGCHASALSQSPRSQRRRRQRPSWSGSRTVAIALVALSWIGRIVGQGFAAPPPSDSQLLEPLTLGDLENAPGVTVGSHPSVVILGTAKGGTTDLHSYILRTYGLEYFNLPVRKELAMLSKRSEKFDLVAYHRMMNADGPKPFTIDSTPGYVNYGPRVIENINKVTRDANMILMLREPVSRTHSLFNHWYITNRSPFGEMNFTESMEFEFDVIATLGKATFKRLLTSTDWREQVVAFEELCQHFKDAGRARGLPYIQSVLLKGIYSQSVMLYAVEAFSRGKALILQSEFYYGNVRRVLYDAVTPFLFGGANTTHAAAAARDVPWLYDPTIGGRTTYVPISTMTPEMACRLQRFFAPFARRTREVLSSRAVTSKAFVLPPVSSTGPWWWRDKDYCAVVPKTQS